MSRSSCTWRHSPSDMAPSRPFRIQPNLKRHRISIIVRETDGFGYFSLPFIFLSQSEPWTQSKWVTASRRRFGVTMLCCFYEAWSNAFSTSYCRMLCESTERPVHSYLGSVHKIVTRITMEVRFEVQTRTDLSWHANLISPLHIWEFKKRTKPSEFSLSRNLCIFWPPFNYL